MAATTANYPASLTVDYPEKKLNRLTTAFRLFVAVPILIICALLVGTSFNWSESGSHAQYAAGGLVFLPTMLMLLFKQKYPKWWFDWNLAITRFTARLSAYILLLRDEYPSTDEEQAVHIEIPYPDAKELNRWLPLVKWILAIPHIIVLFFLYIANWIAVIVAWFAILFTGNYPRSLFDFVVGVLRWSLRISAYAFILTTDEYPPFSLEA
jgi:hypothetical protein